MNQYDFLKQFLYRNFLQKNTPFSSLKSVHAENDGEVLGTLGSKHTLRLCSYPQVPNSSILFSAYIFFKLLNGMFFKKKSI